jgi:hypothetical protein
MEVNLFGLMNVTREGAPGDAGGADAERRADPAGDFDRRAEERADVQNLLRVEVGGGGVQGGGFARAEAWVGDQTYVYLARWVQDGLGGAEHDVCGDEASGVWAFGCEEDDGGEAWDAGRRDLEKAAKAISELAVTEEPLLRVVLGSDAYKVILGKLKRVMRIIGRMRRFLIVRMWMRNEWRSGRSHLSSNIP